MLPGGAIGVAVGGAAARAGGADSAPQRAPTLVSVVAPRSSSSARGKVARIISPWKGCVCATRSRGPISVHRRGARASIATAPSVYDGLVGQACYSHVAPALQSRLIPPASPLGTIQGYEPHDAAARI